MNIQVMYQSRAGRNKQLAEIIAKEIDFELEPKSIAAYKGEYVDLLFVGGGIYLLMLDRQLKNFLCSLKKDRVKTIVAFSMTAKNDGAKRIIKYCKKIGLNVMSDCLYLPKSTEKDKVLEQVKKFTDNVVTKVKKEYDEQQAKLDKEKIKVSKNTKTTKNVSKNISKRKTTTSKNNNTVKKNIGKNPV